MKNKLITLFILCWLSGNLFAQNGLTGTYSTSFGEIKIVQENDVIYGDYGSKGTLLGEVTYTLGNTKTVKGTFYNNNDKGSFEWIFTEDRYYKRKFTGKYGWGTSLNSGAWNGEDKNRTVPADLKKALWSGKWNTTYGEIFLKQDGNQVTGTYRNIGTINATVKNGGILEGTFTNNGSKGTFSFKIKDDSFEGLWGWGTTVGKEKWTGTKAVKTGIAQSSTSPLSATQLSTGTHTANTTRRYRLKLLDIEVHSVDDGPEGIYAGYELFGIAWCRAFDASGKQVNPFDVTYSDRYGRFWEILPKNYIKTDMKVGVSYPIGKQITFDMPFPASSAEATTLRNSKIVLTVELKDYDTISSSDILGKETITIPLNEVSKYVQGGNPGKGKLTFTHGSGKLTVTFQLEIL
ncbi:hypothetical protein [Algoriphagus taiwanensis]|uniref:MORN repeat protein n=1 Tax=Algoriphagus taiwanensis TaxID=1445656 RepID=A0ABQ6PW40_9BACT|nr:hypothetical protein Ataiwa_04450 [Algoriphagus taiwanensis]